jgi:hypothetical protein
MSLLSTIIRNIFKSTPRKTKSTAYVAPSSAHGYIPHAALAVVVTDGNRPLADAVFRLNEDTHTTTDDNGYAVIRNIPCGQVFYAVEHSDFTPVHGELVLQENTQLLTTLVRVRPLEPPAPVVTPPYRGQLRVQGLAYCDDTGYVLPVLCHFGEAFSAYVRRPKAVCDELDRIKQAGYDGIRFWDVLGYYDRNRSGDANKWSAWQEREVTPVAFVAFSGELKAPTPNYYEHLKAFLIELRERGLVAHHSRGDMNSWKWDQVIAHCRRVGEIQREVGATVIALNESLNEAWQNGAPEPARLREMGDALGNHAIRGNSCGDDNYGGETPDELNRMKRDVAIIHGYRGGESYNRIGHIHAVGYETLPHAKVPAWQGEPTGPGEGVSVGREDHPEALCLMAAMALATHQAWVYMSGNGVFWNGSISEMIAFREVAKVRDYLPKDIMAWPKITHGGDRWRGTRVFVANGDGSLRCDHIFTNDGRFVALVYGAPKSWSIPVERSFEGVSIHPVTGERTPVSLNAGQTWNVKFERGRIVVGTLRG